MTDPRDPRVRSGDLPATPAIDSSPGGQSGSAPVGTMRRRLDVSDLKTYFFLDEGILKAVDNVSLYINDEETVGVIGESGSGKSVMARSLMRLVTRPGEIVGGQGILQRKNGQTVDLFSEWPGEPDRVLRGYRVVSYPTAKGCAAIYFPEANALVPRAAVADVCNTPTSKQIILRIEPGTVPVQTGRPVTV